jgi:hypothetical protein
MADWHFWKGCGTDAEKQRLQLQIDVVLDGCVGVQRPIGQLDFLALILDT